MTSLLVAGTIGMFAATTAGTYVGRAIPLSTDTAAKAETAAPAADPAKTAEKTDPAKTTDQPINEASDGMMPGLTPADYMAAWQACQAAGGVGMAGGNSDKAKAVKELRGKLVEAALKSAGIKPEDCSIF
ncbi:MAG TPA: hypothetical protein VND94_18965 [Terriglobia bacterium]|nr:hypothetical protein [Terriglobia bacterium]